MTTVTTVATEADYVAASRLAYLTQFRRRSGPYRYLAGAVVLLLAAMGYFAWLEGRWDYWGFGLAILVALAIPLGIAANLWLLPRKVRRMFAQQPAFSEPMTFLWSDEAFGIRSAISTIDTRWDQLVGWIEGPASFLVYLTDYQTLFVPKRALGAAETDELRGLLTTHVPPR